MPHQLIDARPGDENPTSLARRVAGLIDDPTVTRLIVAPAADGPMPPDAFFSAVVSAVMKLERLDVEIGYVAPERTPATGVYGLSHGASARETAISGTARPLPLIRDDAAVVLVGRARHLGAHGEKLHGETIVDSERIVDGTAKAVEIEPMTDEPGVRGRAARLLPGGWRAGRAVQTGGTNLVVEREGVLTDRVVKRSTFYRHHEDWLLVTP
ncbi:hypothetical protein [Gordonia shandongensis]|uniref:hypothetical protein n=1 Tax=Gordonia shandongensis TaxID=376351 RepID=UPI0004228ED5|nr:hypothetical protein [Gordonia shandongensis]